MGFLRGTEERKTVTKKKEQILDVGDEITLTEMENQIKKLRKKKAAGEDEVKNKAWLYCIDETKHRLLEILQRVWRGEGFRKGIVGGRE
ncbi:hypothetical protein P5V15_011656 [Pogonomyrmex californicus]